MGPAKKHVVIIGAGISGLAAAHELSKHPSSIQVTVLEARNRIGGRLDTRRNLFTGDHADIPIDFGASWIHGVDPSNPILDLAQAANARLEATNSDVIYYRPGQDAFQQEESNHYWAVLLDIFGRAQEFSRDNRKRIPVNTSFRDWLDHFLSTRQSKDPQLPNYMSRKELKIMPLLAKFWADENAIPLDKVSLKYMDAEDMPPGDHCIMANGYDRVLDVLCQDLKSVDIRLEHIVDQIEYNESSVRISTNRGSFTADIVLVTLPLGVLKSNSVTFNPPLPKRKQTAIQRLGFGTMVKVVLHFPTCFWPKDKHFINFLPIPTSIPNAKLCRHLNERQMKALTTYMNDLANYTSLMPIHNAPIMIAYMANDSAEVFEQLTENEAMEVLVCQLSHYFDILIKDPAGSRPTRVLMSRWSADPFARGSYTSIPVGAHQSDLAEFEIPVGARTVVVSPTPCKQDAAAVDFETPCPVELLAIKDEIQSVPKKVGFQGLNSVFQSDGPSPLHSSASLTDSVYCVSGNMSGIGRANTMDGISGRSLRSHRIYNNHGITLRSTVKGTVNSSGNINKLSSLTRISSGVGLTNYHDRNGLYGSGCQDDAVITHIPYSIMIDSKSDFARIHSSLAGTTVSSTVVDPILSLYYGRILLGIKDERHGRLIAPFAECNILAIDPREPMAKRQQHPQQRKQYENMRTNASRKKPALVMKTIAVDDASKGRIHFAGEHTTPTSFASVHGALMTGRREAAKILCSDLLK
ncbi:hypothetical protein BGZ99_001260 [Dissophora globulifera]|uniref:Amine oxidase domain-containing protein n=1 Tax=Dissophora globulifera TaxID=979702 RepID=A0A9P6R306_9FUNG|nr:hypothetical protein BGZ99_001260 [Dissophora globulifera]